MISWAKKYDGLLIICALLFFSVVQGQTYKSLQYSANEGLPSSYILSVRQDVKGWLWVGTYGGLARFDGKKCENFTILNGLPSNQIDDLQQDSKGRLWIATRSGLCMYDGYGFRTFDSLPIASIRRILIDSQADLWLTGNEGIIRIGIDKLLEGKSKPIFYARGSKGLADEPMVFVKEISPNRFYVGAKDNLYLFENQEFKPIRVAKGTRYWSALLLENSILFSTFNGIKEYKNGEMQRIFTKEIGDFSCFSVFQDRDKKIWVSSENGVYVFDKNRVLLHHFSLEKKELAGRIALALEIDRENNVWVATNEGLTLLSESYIRAFTHDNGLKNDELSFLTINDKGEVLIAESDGIIEKIDMKTLTVHPYTQLMRKNTSRITSMNANEKGAFWVCTEADGAWRIDKNGQKENIKNIFGLKETNFLTVAVDSLQHFVYLAAREQIIRIQYDSKEVRRDSIGQKKDIFDIEVDRDGALWIASMGLWRWQGKQKQDFTAKLQLQNTFINDIKIHSDSTIWLATMGKGIYQVRYQKNDIEILRHYTTQEGLDNNTTLSIEFDNENQLWLGTFSGISRLDWAKHPLKIRRFSTHDGIIPNTWSNVVLAKDNKGNIWASTLKGAMRFELNQLKTATIAPIVHIQSMQIFGKTPDWKQFSDSITADYLLPKNAILPYDHHTISFQFVGISLSNPSEVYYSYSLTSNNVSQWTPFSKENTASFGNLAPGNYTFSLVAMNIDGIKSEIKSLHFQIRSPFWQRWWFYLLLFTGGCAALWAMYQWRIRQIQAIENEKTRINKEMAEAKLQSLLAQMNPHFIFNSLNSIQDFILDNKAKEAARYLAKFAKLIRSILDDSTQSFVPLHEVIQTLNTYLELESLRFNHSFSYEISLDPQLNHRQIQLPTMLLQPFVENAIWHGLLHKEGDKKLTIIFELIDNHLLRCLIKDNGVGREKAQELKGNHKSKGLHLTKAMFHTLNTLKNSQAQMEIIDCKDENENVLGTDVIILIPLIPLP